MAHEKQTKIGMKIPTKLLIIWINVVSSTLFTPEVNIAQGRLRGLRSIQGQNQYYSIPYAVAERFQLPKDPPSWNGVYNAINPFWSCLQWLFVLVVGREDCLVLDVYTPQGINPPQKLPVMVFFHGGAYYYGGKAVFHPEFLVTKNVIVVIVNYRLGVLGFLCLNGVSNLGLRDQVAALKWIQRNIAAFGGDPDNVTICGQSAGAATAAMHLLSKASKGLFHKAILMSGNALAPWAFNQDRLTAAIGDARKLGNACSEKDVYNIFLNAPPETLVRATRDNSVNPKYFKYSPCMDKNSSQPFFHDNPYDILKSGAFNKVPTMIGYTDLEGAVFYGLMDQDSAKEFDKNFVNKISSVFSWCSRKDRKKIARKIRSYYFGQGPISIQSVDGIVNYFSDWVAGGSIHAYSRLLARVSDQPVFNYQFSYMGSRNYAKSFSGITSPGATHIDDLAYIFKPAGLSLVLSSSDKLLVDRVTTMLTNFMKFGNPTPKTTNLLPVRWPPAAPNASNTMRLDRELSIIEDPRENFLQNLLCEYGESGFVPCDSAAKCNPKRSQEKQCYGR